MQLVHDDTVWALGRRGHLAVPCGVATAAFGRLQLGEQTPAGEGWRETQRFSVFNIVLLLPPALLSSLCRLCWEVQSQGGLGSLQNCLVQCSHRSFTWHLSLYFVLTLHSYVLLSLCPLSAFAVFKKKTKKQHSSIISFTPLLKLHSAGFLRAVDTVALPPLLPHSFYQDFNPRLGKINSHSLLSSYLLHPPTTSSNNPLSGCSLTFQLPFLWLYWLVPLLPDQPTWPVLHLDQPGWCEPEVPTVSRGVQKPAAVWVEPPAGPVPSGSGAPLHCFPLLQPGNRGTHSSVRNWALHSSNLLFVLNRKSGRVEN